jgi:peptide/nickel transport system permease protein
VVPIDHVLAAVGDRVTAATYERVRVELGLNLPLWEHIPAYIWTALRASSANRC